jgi:hypothetical protein
MNTRRHPPFCSSQPLRNPELARDRNDKGRRSRDAGSKMSRIRLADDIDSVTVRHPDGTVLASYAWTAGEAGGAPGTQQHVPRYVAVRGIMVTFPLRCNVEPFINR